MIETVIHRVHKAARDCTATEFRTKALDLVRDVISFDTASWGTAAMDTGGATPSDVQVYAQSSKVVQSYLVVRKYDVIGARAMRLPGEPQTLSLDDRSSIGNTAFRAHCERFDYCNLLSTMAEYSCGSLYSFITLARSRKTGSFNAEHRQMMQRLLPHLLDAWLVNCCWHMQVDDDVETTAICEANGRLTSRHARLVSMLRTAYPAWKPPYLPASLIESLARGEDWSCSTAVIRATPIAGMLFLAARPVSSTEPLTNREVTIARQAAAGLSYKEIARALCVSPSTVRNHLHQIYRKLRVTNKTALARFIQDPDWSRFAN